MKWVKRILLALVVILVLIQVVRPNMTNPPLDPARQLVAPPQVQAILDRSCNDCHSNKTRWPWYAQLAPVSWFLADHVKDGRRELNFSEFKTYSAKKANHKLQEVCEQVEQREMPLKTYLPLHPSAQLSDADRKTLCDWTRATRAAMLAPPR